MEIEYGAEVKDKNGKVLGTVNSVLRDAWTGEISKFQVSTELTELDLFISPENVAEATPSEVKLKIAFEEI
jgi:sporulation protein YlmC with PRC-barrel domain